MEDTKHSKNIFIPTSNHAINTTEYHQEILDLIANAGNAYADQYEFLYQNMLDNTAISRYGKGGLYLAPYGYYHPTTVYDHYVSNVSRGRLYNTIPEEGKCTYIYHYTAQKQLLAIEAGSYFIKNPQEQLIAFILTDGPRTLYLNYWKKKNRKKATLESIAWLEKSESHERVHMVDCSEYPEGMQGRNMKTEIWTKNAPDRATCECFEYRKNLIFVQESFLLLYDNKSNVTNVYKTNRKVYQYS